MNRSQGKSLGLTTYDVVIPIKDGEQFIKRAVLSVLNQTILPASVIVVNDSSRDKSRECVEELISLASSLGVKVKWIDSDGVGVSAARNFGISHSTSDIIALLDCDDVWLNHKMELQLEVLEPNVLVHCGYILIDADENFIRRQTESRVFTAQGLFEMNYQVTGSASAAIFRRADFFRISGFDENLRYSEDFDVWLQFAATGSILCVPEHLVMIRQHADSTQAYLRNLHSRIENLESLLYVWDKNRNLETPNSKYKNCKPPIRMWIKWFFMEIHLKPSLARDFERALFSREGIDRVKRLKQFSFHRYVYWQVYFYTLTEVLLYRIDRKIYVRALKKLSYECGRPVRKVKYEYQKRFSKA